jgi:hypothetical protein
MPQSKKLRFIITREGLSWVTKTLGTQKEANAFSLWNNNLGYQGILESLIQPSIEKDALLFERLFINTLQ